MQSLFLSNWHSAEFIPGSFPTKISFTSIVPSVMVKMKRFQELLTQLLRQHSALSHVLPALKDVVSNAINFTSIMSLLLHECEWISAC